VIVGSEGVGDVGQNVGMMGLPLSLTRCAPGHGVQDGAGQFTADPFDAVDLLSARVHGSHVVPSTRRVEVPVNG